MIIAAIIKLDMIRQLKLGDKNALLERVEKDIS